MQFDTFGNSPALHENKKRVKQEGNCLAPLPEIQEVPETAERAECVGVALRSFLPLQSC